MNNSKDESIIRALRQSGKTNLVMDIMAAPHELKPLAIHGNNVTVRDVFGRIHTIPGFPPAEIKRLKAQGVPETFANRDDRRRAAKRAMKKKPGAAPAVRVVSTGTPEDNGTFQEPLAQLFQDEIANGMPVKYPLSMGCRVQEPVCSLCDGSQSACTHVQAPSTSELTFTHLSHDRPK